MIEHGPSYEYDLDYCRLREPIRHLDGTTYEIDWDGEGENYAPANEQASCSAS